MVDIFIVKLFVEIGFFLMSEKQPKPINRCFSIIHFQSKMTLQNDFFLYVCSSLVLLYLFILHNLLFATTTIYFI